MDDNSTVEWLTLIVASVGVGIGLWQYSAARRRQLLIDVQQGDKSTVAFVAMQLWNGDFIERKFPWTFPRPIEALRAKRNTRRRMELFQALCLAAVFQGSGRSMSLIHAALASVIVRHKEYRDELKEIVDRTTVAITRSSSYTDLRSGRRRLNSLRTALGLDGDLRLRLDAYELCADDAARGLDGLAHASPEFIRSLNNAVKQQGSLVVVLPVEGTEYRVVSLGFDRSRGDAAAPTGDLLSAAVKAAKHGTPDGLSGEEIAAIARRLVATINAIPSYRAATVIATVQGTFSSPLGEAVAKESQGRKHVPLTIDRAQDPMVTVPEGEVSDGDTVIVLDDVYRSGVTMQAAFEALRCTTVGTVIGLTAVCTVSRAEYRTPDHSCAGARSHPPG